MRTQALERGANAKVFSLNLGQPRSALGIFTICVSFYQLSLLPASYNLQCLLKEFLPESCQKIPATIEWVVLIFRSSVMNH
jgi:hypothetical protein